MNHPTSHNARPSAARRNAEFPWSDSFGDGDYRDRNYSQILPQDDRILRNLAEFHADLPAGGDCIEIGAGPNVYPLLAAVRFRSSVLATDISAAALGYLRHLVRGPLPDECAHWQQRLNEIDPRYGTPQSAQRSLRSKCTVERMSVFDLPEDQYDVASMHFVAESATEDHDEFVQACQRAVRCVKRGGAFTVSLMLQSEGYEADGHYFPAVSLSAAQALQPFAEEASTLHHEIVYGSVRDGHDGMLFTAGTR